MASQVNEKNKAGKKSLLNVKWLTILAVLNEID